MTPTNDRLHGHLDLLILSLLTGGSMHGWAIAGRLRILSDQVFEVGQGSIYPALRRLEAAGWISAKVAVSEAGRRARFYSLTPAGRRQLAAERDDWADFAAAVQRVLDAV
ncbi:MAG: PadR family transcriptional regulator [Acidobacteria bacterium]|nr:PadR family transcriptional regulator [Acidobacteriota bacterium]